MDAATTPNTPATRPDPALPETPRRPLPGLGFLDNLAQLPMLRQFALLVGLAASVAIGFAVALWSQQPEYRPLYGSMANLNASQVVDVRQARGLAARALMGATPRQRALEGALALATSSVYSVKAAREPIDLPSTTVFVRDDRKPSASLLLELYAGRKLEAAQVMAIVNLVATSVPELSKDQVTVVDQHGNLLSDQDELNELTIAGRQFEHTRRLEDTYTRRVHSILQPVLGDGR